MTKKTVVLGITGGIAAFKSVQLTSDLIKKGYDVEIIMTKNATQFIQPLSFEALTRHGVMVDTFEKVAQHDVHHISIAKKCEVFVIVPASANVIAKIAHGLADDMLTTTFLAASCPKIIAPAMNTGMYNNPITQNNLKLCKSYGMKIIEPDDGFLACGDQGKGKLADIQDIMEMIEETLYEDKSLIGKKVMISAGPTQEAMDPVRFLSNHSSGKMGYALARIAHYMGGDVTLISGPTHEPIPNGVKFIPITSAKDLFEAVQANYQDQDIIIKAAAVSDYAFHQVADEKIKKNQDELNIQLIKNIDILKWLGEHKSPNQILCGFAMETQDLKTNAYHKLLDKKADMIVANNLKEAGAGFQVNTNIVTLIEKDHQEELPLLDKKEVAKIILNRLYAMSLKEV